MAALVVGGKGRECAIILRVEIPMVLQGGIEVSDESNIRKRFYEKAERNLAHPANIVDVLVTGQVIGHIRSFDETHINIQTDDPYATAWGEFKIIGRVRLTDGLIVLKRESAST